MRFKNDHREDYRADGKRFVYAGLHAHQLALVASSKYQPAAMVSRSKDAEFLIPALKVAGCIPVRGSSGGASKGGASALRTLLGHVKDGRPAFLAVDGPKGPRGTVSPGVALLSQKTGAFVLPCVGVTKRKTIMAKAWDRFQIPWPFFPITVCFGEPIYPEPGETPQEFVNRIETVLAELEREYDPIEASVARGPVQSGDIHANQTTGFPQNRNAA